MLSQGTLFDPAVSGPKPKSSLLPVLTILFVISYSLMTMLIIEQGNTITSQRWLIKQLFSDSSELMALKGKEIKKRAQTQAHPKPQPRTPSPQVPLQEGAKASGMAEPSRKNLRQHPPKPATDSLDARRILVTT